MKTTEYIILYDTPDVVICNCKKEERRTVLYTEKKDKLLMYVCMKCHKSDVLIDDVTRFIVEMNPIFDDFDPLDRMELATMLYGIRHTTLT